MVVSRFLAVALLILIGMTPARAQPANETIRIHTASGEHDFQVELVRSKADMEKGLMFRRYLPDDHGMLFDFGKPQSILMWMKNTYLPLDMVFIDPHGRVVGIAGNTEPLSEAIIPSGAPASGVLEVNAGTAEKIDLKKGDLIRASIFAQ